MDNVVTKQKFKEYCASLSASTKTIYAAVKSVFCPILNKEVVFNAKGFHHLHYKPNGTARTIQERVYKLTLFPLAVPVIKSAVGIHEERDIELPKSRKRGVKKIKAKQYALVAMVGKRKPVRVRVIILEVENTPNPIFWSIMRH